MRSLAMLSFSWEHGVGLEGRDSSFKRRIGLCSLTKTEDLGRGPKGEDQSHLPGESPKRGPRVYSTEELLASKAPKFTWELKGQVLPYSSCRKLQTLYLGTRDGRHFLLLSPHQTEHLPIVTHFTHSGRPAVASLPLSLLQVSQPHQS